MQIRGYDVGEGGARVERGKGENIGEWDNSGIAE